MTSIRTPIATLAVTVLLACLSGAAAHAQVCGDANGDGLVNDTDGVLILRAAAALSSTCTAAACDVNGDGQTTDTDGVLALRKAAQLSITENCPDGASASPAVEALIEDQVLPVVGYAAGGAAVGGAANAQPAQDVTPCSGGGTIEFDTETQTVTFDECVEDGVVTDGDIVAGDGSVGFDFTFEDLATGDTTDFDGDLGFVLSGNDTIVNGEFAVSFTSGDLEEFIDFNLAFNSLTVAVDVDTGEVAFKAGSLRLDVDLVDDPALDGVTSLELGFGSGTNVPVTLQREDGSTENFVYHLDTEVLTRT